jgi:hypothetical protein
LGPAAKGLHAVATTSVSSGPGRPCPAICGFADGPRS